MTWGSRVRAGHGNANGNVPYDMVVKPHKGLQVVDLAAELEAVALRHKGRRRGERAADLNREHSLGTERPSADRREG